MATNDNSEKVKDVLVGDNSVIIESSERSYKFEKVDENTVEGHINNLDEIIINALTEKGFDIESNYPKEIVLYAHDEPEPYDYVQVADKLDLEEDSSLAREIAGITTEVELTIKVYEDNTWEVTHVFGTKLETPHSYTR